MIVFFSYLMWCARACVCVCVCVCARVCVYPMYLTVCLRRNWKRWSYHRSLFNRILEQIQLSLTTKIELNYTAFFTFYKIMCIFL